MIIERMKILRFGRIGAFAAEFDPRFAVLPEAEGRDVIDAARAVLCGSFRGDTPESAKLRSETVITAEIRLNERLYRVSFAQSPGASRADIKVLCGGEPVAAEKFFRAAEQIPEAERLNQFLPKPQIPYSECLRMYRDPGAFCGRENFSKATSGIGVTDSFRALLKGFMRDYLPQPVPGSDDMQAVLRTDGTFAAEPIHATEEHIRLNKEAAALFELQCFLNINSFWEEIEKIRNPVHGKSPLFITGLPKSSIALVRALAQEQAPERQILLLPCRKGGTKT